MARYRARPGLVFATLFYPAFTTAVAAPGEQSLIEEVVVTAAKREQGIYEVPASLSVFDGSALEEQGIADLVDVGKFVPNLNVTTFSAGHTASANLWGAKSHAAPIVLLNWISHRTGLNSIAGWNVCALQGGLAR